MGMGTTAIPRNISEFNDISDVDVPENAGDTIYYDGTDWVDLPVGNTSESLVVNGAGNAPSWAMVVPIGSVIAWLGDYTNTPSLPGNFVECNGQTLSDSDSVYNGQTIPDLNGGNRFLRGNSTTGGTGGSETYIHTKIPTTGDSFAATSDGSFIDAADILPPYYNITWIMRIK